MPGEQLREPGHVHGAARARRPAFVQEAQMMGIELARKPAQHLFVFNGIVGFGELSLALEIGDANLLAERLTRRLPLSESGRQRLDAQSLPAHGALEEQRIGKCLAVVSADVDEDAAALAAKEVLEKKAVLPDLGIEF